MIDVGPPTLVTERLSLSIGLPRDAEAMAAYLVRNRVFHEPTSPILPAESYAAEVWGARFEAFREEFARRQSLRLLVRARSAPEGDVLGVVNFSNFVWGYFRACHLGFALDERWQGRGVMRDAAFDDAVSLRAVRVGPGESAVSLRYTPPGLRVGAVVSALSLVAALAAYARARAALRARRASGS